MKATLEFNLEDADQRTSHLRCVKATDMAIALWYISSLRTKLERIEELAPLTTDDVMNHINDILENNGINPDELCN